jgi:siroheme synthase (precorrin-2 oxidase/ferrochelatase)
MNLFPIFLKLGDRSCIVVGAGDVALDKVRSLLPTGLWICVVAPEANTEIQRLAV